MERSNLFVYANKFRTHPEDPAPTGFLIYDQGAQDGSALCLTGCRSIDEPYLVEEVKFIGFDTYERLKKFWQNEIPKED